MKHIPPNISVKLITQYGNVLKLGASVSLSEVQEGHTLPPSLLLGTAGAFMTQEPAPRLEDSQQAPPRE